jgi:hypothetical protein
MTAKLKLVSSNNTVRRPPRKLGKHGTQLWNAVNREVILEDAAGIEMLTLACQAVDRAESCREQIDREGEVTRTKTGAREHCLLKIELANRAFITRSLARLGLDAEPIRTIGRPAARGYDGED